jgi:AcrR family transcriptional regulator
MTATTPFQRARSGEQKQRRAADLLDSARTLAAARGVRSVTLTEIANQAGIHVSAVRRYYESREEILLQLAGEGWRDWAAAVTSDLAAHRPASADTLAQVLATSLGNRGLFCDLLGHVSLSLEREVSIDRALEFKVLGLDAVDELVAAIRASVPVLSTAQARDVVATAASLAASAWQASHPPPSLQQLYREDPRLRHDAVEFVPTLRRTLRALVGGMLTDEPT